MGAEAGFVGEVNGEGEATTGPGDDNVGDAKAGIGLAAGKVAVGLAASGGWVARIMLVGSGAGAGGLPAQETASPATANNCTKCVPRKIK